MSIIVWVHLSLLSILFILPSCHAKSTDITQRASNDSISENVVSFDYDFKMKKMILIPGILNDSIHLKFLLETGAGSMVFPDNLACDFEKQTRISRMNTKVGKPMKVKIGHWIQTCGDSIEAYYLDKDNHLFKFVGANVAFIPWDFFDRKIIEISFSKQFIRELTDDRALPDYDSVRITVEKNLLVIPVSVILQGKEIKERVLLDTGNNGDVTFNYNVFTKYNINEDGAYYGKSKDVGGFQAGFSLPADTIKVGKYFVTRGHYVTFHSDKGRELPFAGIIGNKFFENFDIVLDLKNYYLYLKPIDN